MSLDAYGRYLMDDGRVKAAKDRFEAALEVSAGLYGQDSEQARSVFVRHLMKLECLKAAFGLFKAWYLHVLNRLLKDRVRMLAKCNHTSPHKKRWPSKRRSPISPFSGTLKVSFVDLDKWYL